jgi:hypothetical protein
MAFANLTEVLILGDESGAHITLDPSVGAIRLYDNDGILRAELQLEQPDGFPTLNFYSPNGLEKSYIRPFITIDPSGTGIAMSGGDSGGTREVLLTHSPDFYRVLFTGLGALWAPELNMAPSANGIKLALNQNPLAQRAWIFAPDGMFQSVGFTDIRPIRTTAGDNPTFTGVGSDTYAQRGNTCGTAFVAPISGAVKVTLEGLAGNNATTVARSTFRSFEVREGVTIGVGTVVQAASDATSTRYYNKSNDAGFKYDWHSVSYHVTGLTPGDDYNVEDHARQTNTADTGALLQRSLFVDPMLTPP